jgi:predicted GIY-YIG superfamily endonuclease
VSWKKYDLLAVGRLGLPRVAGVYAIYFDDELVYVGSTCDLANRFSEHAIRFGYGHTIITPWRDVPNTTQIHVKFKASKRLGQWAMDEIRLIAKLQPSLNTHYKRRKRA